MRWAFSDRLLEYNLTITLTTKDSEESLTVLGKVGEVSPISAGKYTLKVMIPKKVLERAQELVKGQATITLQSASHVEWKPPTEKGFVEDLFPVSPYLRP